jgi:hypothetical protein
MYQINIECRNGISRLYTAENYSDAMDLFYAMTKVSPLVQVLKGLEVVAEYNNQ